MKIVEFECERELDCAASVGVWNYWDMEHPQFVHSGMHGQDLIYETKDFNAGICWMINPMLPFIRSSSVQVIIRHDENTFVNISNYFGVPSVVSYKITEPRKDHSVYKMKYTFYLTGWRVIWAPLVKYFLPKWNLRTWTEDLPLKIRRQKVLRMGFKDFVGLPDNIEDRFYEGPLESKIPLNRPPGSPVDNEAFTSRILSKS